MPRLYFSLLFYSLGLMKKCLLLTVILTSCDHKDTPVPTGPAFSCQLDGKTLTPNAHTELIPASASPTGYLDILNISTASTGSPMSITVHYLKPAGSANSAYKLNGITYVDANASGIYTRKLVGTLAKTSSGGWSGTFAGEGDATAGGYSTLVPTIITQGVFTEIKP
jgi:hypothetical protein